MSRVDQYHIAFGSMRGNKVQKQRPAIIVSSDAAVRIQNRVQAVPMTTSVTRVYGWEALVQVNGVPHKALADQIRAVAKERLSNSVGALAPAEMLAVERAIRVQLGLP